jgi:hypothetical protein
MQDSQVKRLIALPGKREWHYEEKSIYQNGYFMLLPEDDMERLPVAIIDKSNDLSEPVRLDAEPLAMRLAACWNACAGLPTDMLEGASAVDGVVSSIIEVSNQRADDIKRLKAQLDDLVNALALEGQYWATVEEGGFQAGAEFLKSKGHSGKTSPNDFFEQKKHAALEKIVATHG